jgi:peptide/nickel transport system permease protein
MLASIIFSQTGSANLHYRVNSSRYQRAIWDRDEVLDNALNLPLSEGGVTAAVTRARRSVRRNRSIAIGVAVLGLMLLAAVALPLPYNPTTPDPTAVLHAPSSAHLFGTDSSGFDVFSRTIAAGKRDIPLALAGTLGAMLIGVTLGLFAAFGRIGEGAMRVVDAFAALPMILIVVVVVQLMGGGLIDIFIALVVVSVPVFMRTTRGQAIGIRSQRFIEAANAIGCSQPRVAFRHILPNSAGIILAQTSLAAADAIAVIATMGFLGVGVAPPTPDWGSMIQGGAVPLISGQWWVALFPALAVFIAVSALNFVADGIERCFEGTAGGK